MLVEAFDTGSAMAPRLTIVSARNQVGVGDNILIAGITVTGTGTKRVLLRAVGPTLVNYGLEAKDVLTDPKLELYNYSTGAKLDENDNWAASLTSTMSSAGAFALKAGSKDAALIATLTAGVGYTVKVSGVGGLTGDALVEVYELP